MAEINSDLASAGTWKEYSVPLAEELSTVKFGKCARRVVLKEAGTLYAKDVNGDLEAVGLAAWFPHDGQVSAVTTDQAVDFIVYW